jgi:hypothetical protein
MTPEERSDLGTLLFLDFGHEGRQFYVLLALGSETGDDELHTVELMLDRIVIRPEVAPGWTFTEIPFTIREGSGYALGGGWLFAWSGAPDRTGDMRADGMLVNIDTGESRPISDAPIEGRYSPSVVWTGTEFIVFGGHSFTEPLVDGAAYDPATGSWRQIASAPMRPAAYPAAAWTGEEMVVWLAGEDYEPNQTAQPGLGQLASYDVSTGSWTRLDHPDLQVVDATLFALGSDGLILVGGPNMRDQGFYGDIRALSATVFDSATQSWSQPITGPNTAGARAFILGDRLAVITEDEVHLLSEGTWQPLAQFTDGCGFDWAAASGGGNAYLRCGSYYRLDGTETSPILGANDYGYTFSTYTSAFLVPGDGRLVVMGDSNEGGLASGIVVFGVYKPDE